MCYGGRAAGGSTQEGALSLSFALEHPGSRILCVRGTQNKISESSLQILKDDITLMEAWDLFDSSENQLWARNGSEFLFYGAKNYQSFRSLQRIGLVWIDEAHELCDAAWEVLIPTIRPFFPGDPDPRFLIRYNPQNGKEAVHQRYFIDKHPSAALVPLNYFDNPFLPDTLRDEMEHDRKTNYAKYLHIWEGHLRSDTEGALWKHSDFIRAELFEQFDKIVIGVDPSGSARGDECGIVADGRIGKRFQTIADVSVRGSPLEWASAAVNLYRRLKADRIVVESNFGGEMAETIIHQIDRVVSVHNVHASRGKLVRAEPIHALYEQGLVSHAQTFVNLEFEMTTFKADPKQKSPNRLDAHVFAMTELSGLQSAPFVQTKTKMPIASGYRTRMF